ncbi:hypothetical protein DdX_14360 [Ditylenchus destructor]|uniref:Uncharacterized protein n=1 Tax=Ditylenchus destructor TaxID=166010 RepID=A0AAD4MUP7_9BILA|nr:hypothetical protein DdX_14360 [Ditylenchus destructor]
MWAEEIFGGSNRPKVAAVRLYFVRKQAKTKNCDVAPRSFPAARPLSNDLSSMIGAAAAEKSGSRRKRGKENQSKARPIAPQVLPAGALPIYLSEVSGGISKLLSSQ